jgi:GR25 family glycosyltransferase involved in LPS biosynthesis
MDHVSDLAGGLGTATAAAWDGYYINLDRASARRTRIGQQLRDFGLGDRYRRFRAVDGRALNRSAPIKPGEVGIYRSHLDLLQWIAVSGRMAHVLEDDALLCDLTIPAIESAISRLGTDFDILFTDTFVQDSVGSLRFFLSACQRAMWRGAIQDVEQIQVADVASIYLGCLPSFVVTPQAAAKLAETLSKEWARGPRQPVDLIVHREIWARRLRAYCTIPFVTTVDLELSRESQSDRNDQPGPVLLQQLMRYSFFVRRDLNGYATQLLETTMTRLPLSEDDPAREFNAKILRYMLMPQITDGSQA